jgi:hypothetical protein
MEQIKIPPRLHVLIANKSKEAIVIRKGPSKSTAIIRWNRQNDTFTLGQWLRGKIYQFRCDISPHGKYWIYFAIDSRGKQYTAVALTPYLKAIDFYEKDDGWNGGGLFTNEKTYWLNEGGEPHKLVKKSFLKVESNWKDYPNLQAECPWIYSKKLERDGWSYKMGEKDRYIEFTKQINGEWDLIKIYHLGNYAILDGQSVNNKTIGQGVYHEEHILSNKKSGEKIAYPNWEWAELEDKRIVFAEGGKLFELQINNIAKGEARELYDFSDMKFEAIKAPY